MKIRVKDTIGGHPALDVRRLLRRFSEGMSVGVVRDAMEIDEGTATDLLGALEADGLVERLPGAEISWRTTIKGNALAMASAAAPLRRGAADKMLLEFLARVEQIRDESRWCFRVGRAVVFGSYLSDAPALGDVDVAIELRKAHSDPTEQEAAEDRSRDEAEQSGRNFPTFFDRLFWPEREVRMFLKARSRLSLHDIRTDAPVVEAGPHVAIYADERVCRSALPLLGDWSSERSRAIREGALATKESRTSKRKVAQLKQAAKEQEEILAKLRHFKAMSPEEKQLHADEIDEFVAQIRRRYDLE